MGLIKEPLEVDFIVDSRPLTTDEETAISEFIKSDKEKKSLETNTKVSVFHKVPKTEKV
ncbi:hypothetical protein [Dyadobacter frigoris]|uniref:hypothetical protein n=1 Tax=Dyadobacter frigoris TaxID=2576211 RepID=UPI0014859A95|nr:hypothetical protein [Dyadobacter frigoris]GLU54093.1 hypothetical protein Dfri01_35540 [Dyadobacter frigoris]